MNNLYWIRDKDGKRIKFKMNWLQEYLYQNMWYMSIVLKARQMGVTTFFSILFLDDVLFTPNQTATIIAHKVKDAQRIFRDKIKYAFDNLPDWIKSQYDVNTDNKDELVFSPKGSGGKDSSSISVSTSVRSTTVQRLHISEFAWLCRFYPEKAEEIVTGAINAVASGQMITIESTAKGNDGYFYDYVQKALDMERQKKKLSVLDFRLFFFPWWKCDDYRLDTDQVVTDEMAKYFSNLQTAENIVLDKEQMNWYIAKRRQLVTDSGRTDDFMFSEYPSTVREAFASSIDGAYYATQMAKVRVEGRIGIYPWVPTRPVDTWWDLGYNDMTSIIFTQNIGDTTRVIDYHEDSGESLVHYYKVLKDKPYIYGRHYGPHDLEQHELGTGKTRLESARLVGLNFSVAPKLSIQDGIEQSRIILNRCYFNEAKTSRLVACLDNYRKEWDDKRGTYKDRPLHDEYSHGADAFRTMSVSIKLHEEAGMFTGGGVVTTVPQHGKTDPLRHL